MFTMCIYYARASRGKVHSEVHVVIKQFKKNWECFLIIVIYKCNSVTLGPSCVVWRVLGCSYQRTIHNL